MKFLLVLLSLASVGGVRGIPGDVGIRVWNGTDAFPGQFPYMVAVQDKASGAYRRGGVLIDQNWVITDSFNFGSPDGSQVVLGLHDFDNFGNGGQPEVYDIEQAIREPSNENFILLLKLSRPVATGNPYIQTISLAPQDDYDYIGANCYYCGWGAPDEHTYPGGVLQYSPANIVSAENCSLPNFVNDATEICVDDEYSGTCTGDDGSPLVCRRDDQTYLVGTLSYNSNCGRLQPWPSVFHRVYYYSDWIKAVIG